MSTRRGPAERWRRFILLGVLAGIVGLFVRDADAGFALVLFVVGAALVFAGLIGGAVRSDD